MPNEIDIYWLRRHLLENVRVLYDVSDCDSMDDYQNGIQSVMVALTNLLGIDFDWYIYKDINHIR